VAFGFLRRDSTQIRNQREASRAFIELRRNLLSITRKKCGS
jgi:hypothetical protein